MMLKFLNALKKEPLIKMTPNLHGLMGEFNVGLELRRGLLLMVWDTSLRIVQRHAITILIFNGGDGSPALVLAEV